MDMDLSDDALLLALDDGTRETNAKDTKDAKDIKQAKQTEQTKDPKDIKETEESKDIDSKKRKHAGLDKKKEWQEKKQKKEKWGARWFSALDGEKPQDRMIEHAKEKGHMYFTCHETVNPEYATRLKQFKDGERRKEPPKSFRAYASFSNRQAYLTNVNPLPLALRTFYELIDLERVVRLHLDIEYEQEGEESAEGNEQAEKLVQYLVETHLLPALKQIGVTSSNARFVYIVGTRHEPGKKLKQSQHLTFPDVLFENNHTALYTFFHTLVLPKLTKDPKLHVGEKCIVDKGIYTKHRVIRSVGDHKASDTTRTSLAIKTGGTLAESFVMPEEAEMKGLRVITLQDITAVAPPLVPARKTTKTFRTKATPPANDPSNPTNPMLKKVTELLRNHGEPTTVATEMDGKLVKCQSSSFRPCSTAPNGRHDSLNCYCVIKGNEVRMFCHGDNCDNSKAKNPKGTLIGFLGNGFDPDEKYYWRHFVDEFHNAEISDPDVKAAIIMKAPRVFAQIESGKGYHIRKIEEEKLFDTTSAHDKYTPLQFKTIVETKKTRKVIEVPWSKFVCQNTTELPRFTTIMCKPNPIDQKEFPHRFNVWTGFKAKEVKGAVDMGLIQPWLDHCKDVLACGNEEIYEFANSYFAHICQRPWEKTKVALFFVQKEQQTGRGIFFNFLIRYLFGPELAIAINSISGMGKQWNQWLVGKLFVFIDELSTKHGEYHDIWDAMKHYITEPRMQIYERNKNEIWVDSHLNFAGATQHASGAIHTEQGDARQCIIQSSAHKKGDSAYFDNLVRHTTQEVANHLYTYWLRRPYTFDRKKIPVTDLKLMSQQNSLSAVVRFWQDIRDGHYYGPGTDMRQDDEVRVSDAHSVFLSWCDQKHEKRPWLSQKNFSTQTIDMLPKVKGRDSNKFLLDFSKVPARFI